jgi:hypothetical protein
MLLNPFETYDVVVFVNISTLAYVDLSMFAGGHDYDTLFKTPRPGKPPYPLKKSTSLAFHIQNHAKRYFWRNPISGSNIAFIPNSFGEHLVQTMRSQFSKPDLAVGALSTAVNMLPAGSAAFSRGKKCPHTGITRRCRKQACDNARYDK